MTLKTIYTINKIKYFAISIIIMIIIWFIMPSIGHLYIFDFSNLPLPNEVLLEFLSLLQTYTYWEDLIISFNRVLIGSVIGIFASLLLVILCTLNWRIKALIIPMIEIFRPIPLLAYIPIISIVLRNTEISIIFITTIGAFFPIFVNLIDGVEQIPQRYEDLFHNQKFLKLSQLYVPILIPKIYTGVLIAISSSWMGVITAEILSGKSGIGYFTWQSYNLFKYENVIIGMFSIGFAGILCALTLRLIKEIYLNKYFEMK
ncbi:ABC transporter permease subunit [Staphylococcus saprophyticus]|nr:ABC transporter permease subunit [Staphylococcus saprophyticus]